MKAALPSLSLRTTRVRLLASTYEDALVAGPAGGRGDEHGSRLLLHDDMWSHGSYQELEHLIVIADAVFRREYLGVQFKHHPVRDLDVLRLVAGRMPANIYVPREVAENAGYLASEAGTYRMPVGEQRRRWARRPAKGAA